MSLKSSEKSNVAPDDEAAPPKRGPGRPFTPERARELGRRGGLARWQVKDEDDEREPAAVGVA
jgi:hypothetical protein